MIHKVSQREIEGARGRARQLEGLPIEPTAETTPDVPGNIPIDPKAAEALRRVGKKLVEQSKSN